MEMSVCQFDSVIERTDQVELEEKSSPLLAVELDSQGVSQLGWPFESTSGWAITGNGVGEGDHGDDGASTETAGHLFSG